MFMDAIGMLLLTLPVDFPTFFGLNCIVVAGVTISALIAFPGNVLFLPGLLPGSG